MTCLAWALRLFVAGKGLIFMDITYGSITASWYQYVWANEGRTPSQIDRHHFHHPRPFCYWSLGQWHNRQLGSSQIDTSQHFGLNWCTNQGKLEAWYKLGVFQWIYVSIDGRVESFRWKLHDVNHRKYVHFRGSANLICPVWRVANLVKCTPYIECLECQKD